MRTGLKCDDPLASDDSDMLGDNPLVVLMEYCRLQNLRLVDVFKALDTDRSQSLSYSEFKEGLKASIPCTLVGLLVGLVGWLVWLVGKP